jgi:2',3'-cyclic-nucleotide 2'-phosphodiesterase (5'-nucleotidase family)
MSDRRLPLVAILAALVLMLAVSPGQTQDVSLTIVHVNDLSRAEEIAGRGGIARLAALIARERAGGRAVIVTHGGNAISPSLLSGFDHGAHMIELLNRLGIDVMAVGNHEFDFGPAVLAERAREAHFPLLVANARAAANTPLAGTLPTWIEEVGGFKIGFMGLTREDTPLVSKPGPVLFLPPLRVAKEMAAALRAGGADLVIALASLDRAEAQALVKSGVVDLVLGSSDEILSASYDGRTVFAASAPQANNVVILDLHLERRDIELAGKPAVNAAAGEVVLDDLAPTITTRFVWSPNFRTVDTARIEPDPALLDAVQDDLERLSGHLRERVGVAAVDIDTRAVSLLSGETVFGSLVTDAMRWATGADVALLNSGAIRGDRQYAAGTSLTQRDILQELPFQDQVVVLRVNGGQLELALENGFSEIERDSGRFPQLSGMVAEYDPKLPPGQRLLNLTVGGKPVAEDAMYRLATIQFVAAGGDGYRVLARAERVIAEKDATLLVSQVIAYIQTAGGIAAPEGQRLVRR